VEEPPGPQDLTEALGRDPVGLDELEALARARLPRMVYDYYAGGSGDEWTMGENRRAFSRWVLRPRVLMDVGSVDLRTTVIGQQLDAPILLAPTAMQRLAHPEGEVATARAAAGSGLVMVLSTISTRTLEDVAEAGSARWFQLYVHRDRELTARLVLRAYAAGYSAVVLTVDTPIVGRRLRDERNRFALPEGIALANLEGLDIPPSLEGSGLFAYFLSQMDPTVTWQDVEWLRSLSPLPVVLKGILTGEDARRAVAAGVAGVIVSNHGGRQLDGVPASLDVLPEVVEAVAGRADVLLDGGVRSGSDALKALALGAKAVLIGRPYLWGLAVDGEAGVRSVLDVFRRDLALAMALAGVPSVRSIDRSLVAPAPGQAAPVPSTPFGGSP
jgi:4-hydroxymandelate oxidase